MHNKIKGMLFRLPAAILLLAGFIGSLVIKLSSTLSQSYPIGWGTVVIFVILLVLYIYGEIISLQRDYPY